MHCDRCCKNLNPIKERPLLSPKMLSFFERTHYNLLCCKCIEHYENLITKTQPYQFPTTKKELKEGLHYYMENNYLIFTELYHFLRGYCCKNGCRHCVYGYNIMK